MNIFSALSSLSDGAKVIEEWLDVILKYFIIAIDTVGAIVIISGIYLGIKAVFQKTKDERIALAKSIGLGLELIMCGEIIRSITVRTLKELIILGIVVVIRAALALLSHWELKNEVSKASLEKKE